MYVQKFGRRLVKPLRIDKNRNGQKKPKPDNARKLRGIYFIDPDDEEYKEILKNPGEENWKRLVAPTVPCKRSPAVAKLEIASEEIADKGFNSLTRNNLVHKFISMLQAIKITECESCGG